MNPLTARRASAGRRVAHLTASSRAMATTRAPSIALPRAMASRGVARPPRVPLRTAFFDDARARETKVSPRGRGRRAVAVVVVSPRAAADRASDAPPPPPSPIPPRSSPLRSPLPVIEVSAGGGETRRWGRALDGTDGFIDLPPHASSSSNADAVDDDADDGGGGGGGFKWDPRESPRLRAMFLPAGYPDTVSSDYARWLRWHLFSNFFRRVRVRVRFRADVFHPPFGFNI